MVGIKFETFSFSFGIRMKMKLLSIKWMERKLLNFIFILKFKFFFFPTKNMLSDVIMQLMKTRVSHPILVYLSKFTQHLDGFADFILHDYWVMFTWIGADK